MRKRIISAFPSPSQASLLGLVFLLCCWGCSTDSSSTGDAEESTEALPDLITSTTTGTVTEVLGAGKYTVACLSTGKRSYWLATERTNLGIGDEIVFDAAQVMRDFYSPALNRQFPVILFVNKVTVVRSSASQSDRPASLPSGHPMVAESMSVDSPPTGAITRAPEGYTVAELHQKKQALAGSKVRIAGKVVKVNANIMGVNWIHLQDGTEFDGENDLTVSSEGKPPLGAVVTAEGVLVAGKTFQKGFHIPLLVENASLAGAGVPAH